VRTGRRSMLITATVLVASSVGSIAPIEPAVAERFDICPIRADGRLREVASDSSIERRSSTTSAGTLFFTARDAHHGREVWRSNGTREGTLLVKDIRPGTESSGAGWFSDVRSTLYFVADDGTHGTELWKSDGTRAGTTIVQNIGLGPSGSNPEELVSVEGTLYFVADDGTHGTELWKSDGTRAGTRMIKDLTPGSAGSDLRELTNVEGTVYFIVEGVHRWVLWKSDGSAAGTVRVSNFAGGIIASAGGTLYFLADDGIHGTELWGSDGTAAGTQMLKDVRPGRAGLSDGRGGISFAVAGDTLYFTGSSDHVACDDWVDELWKTDGTAAGTVLVKDLGGASTDPVTLWSTGDVLYFSNRYLWKSDGTAAGTVLVTDAVTPVFTDWWGGHVDVGGNVYFAGADLSRGIELWRTDGSEAGTLLVKDIHLGSKNSDPHFLTEVAGTLFFVADDGMQGFELWASDGTGAGTAIVNDIWPGSASSRPRPLLEILGGDSATRPWTTRAHTSFATSSTTCSSAERCLSLRV
jgi:ELWxxDGT repeat protein